MNKEKIKELINLKQENSNPIQWILPFAFGASGILMFVSFLMDKQKFSWYATIMGILGTIVSVYVVKKIRKNKRRILKLEEELDLED